MFKPAPKPEKFILAAQDGTIRLNPSIDTEITGLCTDNLRSCLAIIFVGNNGNISFTHTDFRTDASSFVEEAKWVGGIKKFYLIKNANATQYMSEQTFNKDFSNLEDRLKIAFENAHLNLPEKIMLLTDDGIAAIDRLGALRSLPVGFLVDTYPDKHYCDMIIVLNRYFDKPFFPTQLQYHHQWTTTPSLTAKVRKIIENCCIAIKIEGVSLSFNDVMKKKDLVLDYLYELAISKKYPDYSDHFHLDEQSPDKSQMKKYLEDTADRILYYAFVHCMTSDQKKLLSKEYRLRSVLSNEQQQIKAEFEQEVSKMASLAMQCYKTGQLQNAVNKFNPVVELLVSANYVETLTAATIYSNLCSCLRDLGKSTKSQAHLDEAVLYLNKAMSIRKKYYTEDNAEISSLLKKEQSCIEVRTEICPVKGHLSS